MGDFEASAEVSLVKYDNPVLVIRHEDQRLAPGKVPTEGLAVPPRPKTAPLSADARRESDEILNKILPPREWLEDNQLWRQYVSSTPATRLDVINLQEELDMRLQQQQARETGICPVRRKLYTQCFEELIRQVTINCAERGLLLLRVRDEAEQGKADLEDTVEQLQGVKAELEKQVVDLRARTDQIERRATEQRQADEKQHAEEIQNLKRTNQMLRTQLEGITAPKK
ncbi:33 kDa inner dynein arm light chain, axonemal isoform X2 [Bacillus rossius redtenbacheri]|uniref:33 kDa inner dynein arm light chain, axonemal isoform X2 n=1 Tax=Bacillus rossius redtenbacheri TaxID=93214 RepID=UPI002FDD0E86